jgi:predicted RNA binding protein YcfA (HicA-like mRNA interferase family)
MSKKAIDQSLRKVLSGRGNLSFRELEALLRRLGFSLDRVRGSHHIYRHPKASRAVNIQPKGGEAKRYQLDQLRTIIIEFHLLDEQ